MRTAYCGGRALSVFACVIVALALAAAVVTIDTGPARAEEGMWVIHALDKVPFERWQSKGLKLDRKGIYNPKGSDLCDAVVLLGGGTGSFVSARGLILTNHHVAFGALQRQSSVDANYIEDGFLARTQADEVPALGYEAFVILDVKDVTKKILGAVKDDMSDYDRYQAIEMEQKKIVKKAEEGKDIHAEVESFYGGSEYYLYTYFKIKDIRIVYAPPEAIGVYGGDIDNWMWPRHTGDFSFLRAYVSPNGMSAEYSEENVPYSPKHYLPFSAAPLAEGDFAMVIGYPGSTRRYRSSYSIDYYVNRYYPSAIQRYGDIINILEEESQKSPEAEIKLASQLRSFNNGYKNNQGMLEGLKKADLLSQKLKEEEKLRAFLASNPDLARKYGSVLDEIGAQYDAYLEFSEQYALGRWMMYAATAFRSAYTIYKWNLEQEKEDIDRDPGYQDRDRPRLVRGLKLVDKQYVESADKRLLTYFLMKLASLPASQQFTATEEICGGLSEDEKKPAIERFVDELYAGTGLADNETRMKLFEMSAPDLLKTGDKMIEFASKLEEERKALEEKEEAFAGALQKLRPQLMELRPRASGELLYPDANRTMRLSAGVLQGYSPRDAVQYGCVTTLGGVVQKHTGEDPFDVPERLLMLYETKDFGNYIDPGINDVPVCFLTTNDVTGGSSGSPVVNGEGDLIGLVFDGNYESISADYQFIPALTRTISVDSRYILFVLDKYAGANELLEELGRSSQVGRM